MKNFLRYSAYVIVNIRSASFLYFYKIKNIKKKKIFVYTDSRGFEISRIWNRKSPFDSYLKSLIKNYNCTVFICPEKHTTIFDFLFAYNQQVKSMNYDHVIAHVGVVDFSPRPWTSIANILAIKSHKIIEIFGHEFYNKITDLEIYKIKYLGESTSSILPCVLLPAISEELLSIPKLIWVSCNPVDLNWSGNYRRNRPTNINIVNEKSRVLIKLLNDKTEVIDLTNLTLDEVREYTCDNIHLSAKGMKMIENSIYQIIKNDEL